jgi:hypothetical protein
MVLTKDVFWRFFVIYAAHMLICTDELKFVDIEGTPIYRLVSFTPVARLQCCDFLTHRLLSQLRGGFEGQVNRKRNRYDRNSQTKHTRRRKSLRNKSVADMPVLHDGVPSTDTDESSDDTTPVLSKTCSPILTCFAGYTNPGSERTVFRSFWTRILQIQTGTRLVVRLNTETAR